MYVLTIEREFCAAHAIVMRGEREPLHGHNWRVDLTVEGASLDADGLLCDFHALEGWLAEIVAPFENQSLNETPPFDTLNPTAEHVARHIVAAMLERLPPEVAACRATVTEAPGCRAGFSARRS